jgi:hypothetical protein
MGNQRKKPLLLVLAAMALLSAHAARADQTSAQQDAQKTHDGGSSDSLNSSYGNALSALGNFYELNIPGAVSNGVKAYGQYRNSQTMDDLRDRNQHLAGTMATVGNGGEAASTVTGSAAYVSPYARLDTKFLHEGATGEVAGRIEKLSGMSRDQMFKMAVDVHTNSKSPTDPNFIPWAMSTYNGLIAKIPNENFRAGLNAFGKVMEKGIGTGMAQGLLSKVTGASGEPTTMVAGAEDFARAPASAVAVEPSSPMAVAEGRLSKEEGTLESSLGFTDRGSVTTGINKSLLGLDRIGVDPVDGFLGDAMRRAGDDNGPSIFQTVSGKLKELSLRQHLERRAAMAQLPR